MKKVLVLDDHQPSRRRLVDILLEHKYEIAGEGSSATQAIALVRTTAPDLVLMAVGLADRDGIKTAREILNSFPLPIVLVTSHYDAETVQRASEAGVMALLVKPLRAEAVRPAIELAMARLRDLATLRRENDSLKEELQSRKIIERAKGLLMEQRRISEAQAYGMMKQASMNRRKPMAEIAQAILLSAAVDQSNK